MNGNGKLFQKLKNQVQERSCAGLASLGMAKYLMFVIKIWSQKHKAFYFIVCVSATWDGSRKIQMNIISSVCTFFCYDEKNFKIFWVWVLKLDVMSTFKLLEF